MGHPAGVVWVWGGVGGSAQRNCLRACLVGGRGVAVHRAGGRKVEGLRCGKREVFYMIWRRAGPGG